MSSPYSNRANASSQSNDLEADLEALFNQEFEDQYNPYNFEPNNLLGDDGFDDFGMNRRANYAQSPSYEPPSFDERRATATPQPPPSNQQVRQSPAAAQRSRQRRTPEFFEDLFELTPSPPRMSRPSRPNVATRSSSIVDLTSSPVQSKREMAPAPGLVENRKRKRDAPGVGEDSDKATKGRSGVSKKDDLSNIALVDLSGIETDEQYEDFKAREAAEKEKEQEYLIKAQNLEEANKPVKLAEFQCIICMDNPTDLTVTHCGHLFCSECLHSALHAGDKKCCPVCRTVINARAPTGKTAKNGIFALEMKLMTRKKGKQVATG